MRSALVREKEAGHELEVCIGTDSQVKGNVEGSSYILGMGFSFRAKPEAFASSSCANKVVQ